MSEKFSYSIKALRKALKMNTTQLGLRLGISESGVTKLEKREGDGSITLDALRKAAEALEADVFISIEPKQPIEETWRLKAQARAIEDIDLDLPEEERAPLIEARIKWYLENPKRIWQ